MAKSSEQAIILALQALTWITANEEVLPVFMATSGASGTDLAQGARNPAFLAAVLDFLLLDDQTVIGFCDSEALPYDAPMRARLALPGCASENNIDF
ncbi:MAG: hypothetical protein ACI9O0_001315 [Paracoccaceae bacterium]|jgi:hypothetical protein